MRALAAGLRWTPESLRLLRIGLLLPPFAVAFSIAAPYLPAHARWIAGLPLIILSLIGVVEAHHMTAKALNPEEVADYLARFNRAREILDMDADAPDEALAEAAVRQAADRGIGVEFIRTLDEDLGELVWELHVETARGVLTYRRELSQSWEDLLAHADVMGRRG